MLVFGVKDRYHIHGKWVYIEDALQVGSKNLYCPFCDASLVAKNPTKDKPAHFSHKGSVCRYVRILRRIIIHFPTPDYWLYNISLGEKRLFNKLKRMRFKMDNDKFISFHQLKKTTTLLGKHHPYLQYEPLGKVSNDTLEKLYKRQLLRLTYHEFGLDTFELSWKTKMLWNDDWTLKEIYQGIQEHWETWRENNRWDDWTVNDLFSEMYERIEKAHFYLVKIVLDGKVLYKTGTTIWAYRTVERWIKGQLKRYGKEISIEKIYFVDTIALIEPFIRTKYQKYQFKVGHHPGYFNFKKYYPTLKKELHQVTLLSEQHRAKIVKGLETATNVGKRGKESLDGFLAKPKSQSIIQLLESPTPPSLRQIAFQTGSSVNTVQKVKKLWLNHLKQG